MQKADKILVLGIDGMDPRLTRYHMEKGLMPNLKKFLARGSAREDLVLLGAHPTITPPMWTTLSTGAYPMTHGITDFWRQDPERLDVINYALDSSVCKAEQLWNVFAEAGKKTCVFHWPGASWPPTSDSKNLFVVDGTNPEGICQATGQIEKEFLAIANEKNKVVTFRESVGSSSVMCVIDDMEVEETIGLDGKPEYSTKGADIQIIRTYKQGGDLGEVLTGANFDASVSSIKPAEKWAFEVPTDAKEFTILLSRGLIRRPSLLLKNEDGIYDSIAIYKNKKSEQPIVTIQKGEFVESVIDEAIKNDQTYTVTRNMRVFHISEDGSEMRMWISAAVNINDRSVFSPMSLHDELCENVGYPMPVSNTGSKDADLVDCMVENWNRTMRWWADALHYMIEKKGVEVIFSQIHNDDAEKHNFIASYKENAKSRVLPMEKLEETMEKISQQNDYYIGRFLHLLDEGWTIFLVSDHGLLVTEEGQSNYYGGMSVDATFMKEWGYTVLKQDENGNDLMEIDWSKTKAVASRSTSIYINEKGRWKTGIVEPEDVDALQDEIIAKLYSLRDEKGRPIIAAALKNRDAVLLGMGGPECGDIVVWQADKHLFDHGEGLSTVTGLNNTSVSPIFAAAGKGVKENFKTTRYIREVDVAPTIAWLADVRMPAQCEGAPVYQIIAD